MDSTYTFLDLLTLGYGIYCMYTWIRLLREKKLFPNALLVPKEKKPADCVDEEGFIAQIMPPLSVLAIITMAYGVVSLVNDMSKVPFLPYPWNLLPLAAVVAVLVWYAICDRRAKRDCFGI